jgi:multidrug efflux pump subunit AcrB
VTLSKNANSDFNELSSFVDKVIVRRLEQLPEIAFVDQHGYADLQISILPNQDLLTSIGITDATLAQSIINNNYDLGNIILKDGAYQYNVQLTSKLVTIEDVRSIKINHNGQVFALSDLAQIKFEERPPKGGYLLNDQRAIALSIRKQSNANNFTLKAKMDTLMVSFKKEYNNINIAVVDDQTRILKAAYENLFTSLLYGLLFSSLVIFLFIRQWKIALLVIIVVPISLVISLFCFYLLGISLNIISLTGLILGVGLMIDNAIIIIENIRQSQNADATEEAFVKGPNEVIAPVISSALTTCSVFLPLVLLGGVTGALFYDQALSITISLLCSVLVSYYVLPVLAYTIVGNQGLNESFSSEGFFEKLHDHMIFVTYRFKKSIILIGLGLISLGVFAYYRLDTRIYPKTTTESIELSVDWRQQISYEQNQANLNELYNHIKADVRLMGALIGESQFAISKDDQNINEASTTILLMPDKIKSVSNKIFSYLRLNHPQSEFKLRPSANAIDQILSLSEYDIMLYLSSRTQLESPSPQDVISVRDYLNKNKIEVPLPNLQNQISLSIKREKADLYHIPIHTILSKLKTIFNENIVTDLKSSDQYIPIYLTSDNNASFESKLQNAVIINELGNSYNLSDFITYDFMKSYKAITANRSGEMIALPVLSGNEQLIDLKKDLSTSFNGLNFELKGQYFENKSVYEELNFILIIVLALLYLILAAQFESIILPIIVLTTVPISMAGVLMTLYLCRLPIDMMSAVGIIIMSGIVINDAILKVDMIKKVISNGENIQLALKTASDKRLRAIIMTSLTTILALVPVFFSSGLGAEIYIPLAIAIISGITVGTITSIFFVPALYAVLHNLTQSLKAKAN